MKNRCIQIEPVKVHEKVDSDETDDHEVNAHSGKENEHVHDLEDETCRHLH